MARTKKSKAASTDKNAVDYRYPHEKRTNIPPGRIAGEGIVPKVPKVRYAYSAHLPPTLQFDATGEPDKLNDLVEKATRTPLSATEAARLRASLQQHEPWLEWSGKREKRWFEVDPVALHMHERVSTQALLRVAAREDVQRDLFADPQQEYAKAVQFYKHDVDWANRMVLGDSLQVMASLARREGLAGKVQTIYIDPPYGIKFSSNFQSLLGQREVKDREQDLTREPETVKAYRDTWTLGIHSYLSYLRDRLMLAKELLREDGSVFVQISDENLHRVRVLMDEVFSPANFCRVITIKKTAGDATRLLTTQADYILWYAKDVTKVKFRSVFLDKSVGSGAGEQYDRVLDFRSGEHRWIGDAGADLPEGCVAFRTADLRHRGFSPTADNDILFQGRRFFCGHNYHWKTTADGIRRLEGAERLHLVGNTLEYRRLYSDWSVTELANIWMDAGGSGFADPKLYVVQTVTKVVERCLLMTTDPGDLVLDPTCGSGTTAYVAEQWGRRWITCDSSRVALALAKHRLMTAKFDYFQLRAISPEDTARNPDGTWLRDTAGEIPGKATFRYKTVPHITLKSIARNNTLDSIFAKHSPILATKLEQLNSEAKKIDADFKSTLVEKLIRKHREVGVNSVTDGDVRRWLLPDSSPALIKPIQPRKPLKGLTPKQAEDYRSAIPKDAWQEWEVPFDTDSDWPPALQSALTEYRAAWRAKMEEVNVCINANCDMEELVDKPEPVKGVLRVTGPFTVEGVRPEELNIGDGTNEVCAEEEPSATPNQQQNLQAYLAQMVQLIRKDGLTFLNNKRRRFAQMDSLFEASTGAVLHAEGSWEDSATPDILDVAIGFGPQYGPVTALQVEELIHASKRHSGLVIAGFSFDADATALIQEQSHPKLRIHQAYIRPDINPGMDGLLKETPDSQLFTVFGTPEVDVKPTQEGEWIVYLKGVEVYDPVANSIASTGADKVAAWFVDSDFDGRCFCITQAFFPNQDSWEKIAKALGSSADAAAFEAFKGTTSIPFASGKYKRVAVKVIDPRGNEVMAVRPLER